MEGAARLTDTMDALRSGLRTHVALVAFLTLGMTEPPPPGIAYDEIARIVPPGATPPPVGSFAQDAAVIAALPPLVVPKGRMPNYSAMIVLQNIASLAHDPYTAFVNSWAATAAGRLETKAVAADFNKKKADFANGRAVRERTGVLVTFAYYRGWSRIEFIPGYITIDKPDQGLTITLDSAKKTYHSVHAGSIETFTVNSGAAAGTATLDGAAAVETLPPARIEGLPARGYRTSGSIIVTRASNACAAGQHHVTETEYVSDQPDPRYDAVEDASNAQPLVGACAVGSPISHREPGHLVLYRAVMVDEGLPSAFGTALERGNVRALGEADNAMFLPPPNFTEEP
ncbi:MAG: hypothetical protein JO299_09065 [Gammaproteobacteria bacterium]|nr:hypothetical protein [Gammaproteobacteria bacterium]